MGIHRVLVAFVVIAPHLTEQLIARKNLVWMTQWFKYLASFWRACCAESYVKLSFDIWTSHIFCYFHANTTNDAFVGMDSIVIPAGHLPYYLNAYDAGTSLTMKSKRVQILLKLGPEMVGGYVYRVLPVAALPLVLIWVQVARVWVHKSLMAKLKMRRCPVHPPQCAWDTDSAAGAKIWTLPYTVG